MSSKLICIFTKLMCIAAKLAALEVLEIGTKFFIWRAALIAAYQSLSYLGGIVEKDICVKKSAVLHSLCSFMYSTIVLCSVLSCIFCDCCTVMICNWNCYLHIGEFVWNLLNYNSRASSPQKNTAVVLPVCVSGHICRTESSLEWLRLLS